jgi:hypothetical protein
MRKALFIPLLAMLASGCTVSDSVDRLQDHDPPPEFGRPGWVRTFAGVGGWVGGVAGGVVSVVLLPITWPISLLTDEGFGDDTRSEFLWWPATTGASLGHALIGTPPDLIDYVFRRAWKSETPPVNTYELVPMQPGGEQGEQPMQTQRSAEPEPGHSGGR